ncbi:cation:proton antiporter [Streptosporangiaceae bacterium NEAU-GS5]|nr:cation:proton antiporter [Streptosporangiaceae bacterium NEAU-GS5]
MTDLMRVAVALAAVFGVAYCGAIAARALRQPPVIGEIVAGLVAGPLVLAFGGPAAEVLLTPAVRATLSVVGNVGLAIYLVRVTWDLRGEARHMSVSGIGRIVAGAYIIPLAAGAALAMALPLMGAGAPAGTPVAAFVLLVAVALAITAVPALARILDDRATGPAGPTAMAAALCIDVLSWPLLALAIGLAGGRSGVLGTITVTGAGVLVALVLRRPLARPLGALCALSPIATAVVVGAAAVGAAELTAAWGMTHVLGAVLVGLALPPMRTTAWAGMIRGVGKVGARLVPAFFVTTGLTVFSGHAPQTWWLAVVVTAVAAAAKLGGGYVGARLAGRPKRVALRLGVLLNTRGLTELIVLQAGHEAGILTGPVYAAFVVMAVTCTAATAPLLSLTERGDPVDLGDTVGERAARPRMEQEKA